MVTALLLIDFQIDFLSDNGRMPVGEENANRIISTANRLIDIHKERHWPIIVIYNQFKKSDVIGNFFRKHAAVEESAGGRLDPRLYVDDAPLFPKSSSSAFTNPNLSGYLRENSIGHVVICGVYAEGCVRATALDAQRANLRTTLISDGVASNRKFKYKWALSHMQKRRIQVVSLHDYLESSNTPHEPLR